MYDLTELRERLRTQRPVPWDQLPDFSLYMDQVLSYMDRQVIRFDEDDGLTAAMVNNYTKSGLVPRAEGKKYNRDHLAYLTAICVLKQVMSTRDMDLLIREELQGERPDGRRVRRLLREPGQGPATSPPTRWRPDRGRGHPGGRRHPLCPAELCRRRSQQPVCHPAAPAAGGREGAETREPAEEPPKKEKEKD